MRLSLLDYVPLFEGRTPNDALKHSIKLAQHAEKLGYLRYWVAEHHQVYSVVSSAPEIIMMSILEHKKDSLRKVHIGTKNLQKVKKLNKS